jgi:hypothetical protein
MNKDLNLPNFVVAGAAKSGSTSLYAYIKEHPEIFLPTKKESRFFASEKLTNTLGYNKTSIFTWEDFTNQYALVNSEHKAIGDFGNLYMIFPELAIENIKKQLGDNVKVVFIIRNPIKRAYSAYQMARRNFYEDKSFAEGLELENERLQKGYVPCDIIAYKKMGLYAEPITEFKKHFDVHVIVLEELKDHTQRELKKLYNFLGVSDTFELKSNEAQNKGGSMPTKGVGIFKFQKFLKSLKPIFGFIPGLSKLSEFLVTSLANVSKKKNKKAEPLSAELELKLFEIFRADVKKTSELLTKDLWSIWGFNKYEN